MIGKMTVEPLGPWSSTAWYSTSFIIDGYDEPISVHGVGNSQDESIGHFVRQVLECEKLLIRELEIRAKEGE